MFGAAHRFSLGRFDILVVKDGIEGRTPLHAFVVSIPAELARQTVYMLGGLTVIDTPDRRFLIDAGNPPWKRGRTHVASTVLGRLGVAPESVDRVLITHGDLDHVGGLLTSNGRLSYPNARLTMHRALWRSWQRPTGQRANARPGSNPPDGLTDLLQGRVDCFEEEQEVLPEIHALPLPGHRVGHTGFRIVSGGETLFHIGDAAFDPIFLERPSLANDRDTNPAVAAETRACLVKRAIAERALVVGSHFRLPATGRLVPAPHGARWVSVGHPAADPGPQ